MKPKKYKIFNTAVGMFYPREHFAINMDGESLQLMAPCPHYRNPFIENITGAVIYIEWTGRTDTNGTEIYEDDIVEYKGDKAFIAWEKDGWRVVTKELGMEQSFALGSISGKDIKVVGSKYEPEPEDVADSQ